MSPPVSSSGKRASSSRPAAAAAAPTSKKAGSSKGSGSTGGKRSASSAALEEEDAAAAAAGSKRTKRNASSKKSLREEELGVGAQLADDDVVENVEDAILDEDVDDEGDGGVTRCVCGEDNEEMASGLMIQCDTCKCWQHGPCVGLWDEKECPNRYFCELCKPNLHGPGGLLRKVARKSSAAPAGHAASPPSAAPAAAAAALPPPPHKGHKPRESADAALIATYLSADGGGMSPEQKPTTAQAKSAAAAAAAAHKETKKRSTMNSRDAAYDDAIALSILEAGTAAMRARLEKPQESEGEQSDIEEVVISGAGGRGKGKKVTSRSSRGGRASSASARGGKGKSARGRRETSNLEEEGEEESPVPPTTAEAMKEEMLDPAESTQQEDKAIETSLEPNGDASRDTRAGDDASGSLGSGARGPEEAEASRDRSMSPEGTTHAHPAHTGRSKHPNQYTYRGKNGPGRGGKSPSKRGGASASSLGNHGHSSGSFDSGPQKPLSGAAAQAVAGWGMPDHLRHLAHLLPSPSPSPLSVPSIADPSEPPSIEPPTKVRFPGKRVTMPEMRKRARAVLEFVTRVQLEMSERDRRWNLLRDVNVQVKAARERDAQVKAQRAAGSGSGSGSGSGLGTGSHTAESNRSRASSVATLPLRVGGTTPVPGGSTVADPSQVDLPAQNLPPIPDANSTDPLALSSAASPVCVELMDTLSKEVAAFQQKFFGQVD